MVYVGGFFNGVMVVVFVLIFWWFEFVECIVWWVVLGFIYMVWVNMIFYWFGNVVFN